MVFYVYVVQGNSQYGDRWYVGCCEDPEVRIRQHQQGPKNRGCCWMGSCFRVVRAEPDRCFNNEQEALDQEARRTAELMYIHGPTQVRGGPFPYKLPSIEMLIPWICHLLNLPYDQARRHFAPEWVQCTRCLKSNHLAPFCRGEEGEAPAAQDPFEEAPLQEDTRTLSEAVAEACGTEDPFA
jgi:predicted GIY-YIG superfamily endonuclease